MLQADKRIEAEMRIAVAILRMKFLLVDRCKLCTCQTEQRLTDQVIVPATIPFADNMVTKKLLSKKSGEGLEAEARR